MDEMRPNIGRCDSQIEQ